MPTDIYGVIEVFDTATEGQIGYIPGLTTPWVRCLDLWPLYPGGGDYPALGCLFGVRNWIGWEPVAELRGLPADVSASVREEYEYYARGDSAIGNSTWIAWPELRDLDMTVTPRARGMHEVTRLDVLGPGTGWEHVFAVMRALAGRFGEDGVRLVAWFD